MYETCYKQASMVLLSSNQGANYLVPVGGLAENPGVNEIEPVDLDSALNVVEEPVEEDESSSAVSSGDTPGFLVSSGDVSGSDVSFGDVSGGSASTPQFYFTCAYEPKPKLWESDIGGYDTTDGLLLLILIFTVINTAINAYWRRRR